MKTNTRPFSAAPLAGARTIEDFLFDDAKVRRFFVRRIIFHPLSMKKHLIIDKNQPVVLAHNLNLSFQLLLHEVCQFNKLSNR